jgi:general stress protein 26
MGGGIMAKHNDEASVEALADRIKGITTAMFTTLDDQGNLWARPMATQDMDDDGTLWFFTKRDSEKVDQIKSDHRINLSYVKPDDSLYISITGNADIINNQAKKEELWNTFVKAWFPDGVDDPDLVLLRVIPEYAEYWEGPKTGIGRALSILTKVATGGKSSDGKDVKVNLS